LNMLEEEVRGLRGDTDGVAEYSKR